jgi:hypothetical protein
MSRLYPQGVHRLNDPDNARRLEELARFVAGDLHASVDFPELLSRFGAVESAPVIHARWVEFGRYGLRACVVTNSGRSGGSRVSWVFPCQVVAVFLPGAAVQHLLQPATPGWEPDLYPHMVLAWPVTAETAASWPNPMQWHLPSGQLAVELSGPHGFRFAGCLDGVLYARSDAPRLDLSAALSAVDELAALARNPWSPPSESDLARVRGLVEDSIKRSRRRWTIFLTVMVVYLVGGVLFSWCLLHRR